MLADYMPLGNIDRMAATIFWTAWGAIMIALARSYLRARNRPMGMLAACVGCFAIGAAVLI